MENRINETLLNIIRNDENELLNREGFKKRREYLVIYLARLLQLMLDGFK